MALTTDGTSCYVTDWGHNALSIIDTASNHVTSRMPLGHRPSGIVMNPNGARAYVTNESAATLSVVHTTDHVVLANVTISDRPEGLAGGLAVRPDFAVVYVADLFGDRLSVIGAFGSLVNRTISIRRPRGVIASPDSERVYVSHALEGDDTPSTVAVLDAGTLREIATVEAQSGAGAMAISPNGAVLCVANSAWSTLSVIDGATNTVRANVPTGNGPGGVAVSPDGGRVYVTNHLDSTVSVFDTTSFGQ